MPTVKDTSVLAENFKIDKDCNYCGGSVIFVSSEEVFGEVTANPMRYICTTCGATVGVHRGTSIPYGKLADRELSGLRKRCHALLDPIWRSRKGHVYRSEVYNWLAKKLNIPSNKCHIGWFDKQTLKKAVSILESYGNNHRKIVTEIKGKSKDREVYSKRKSMRWR